MTIFNLVSLYLTNYLILRGLIDFEPTPLVMISLCHYAVIFPKRISKRIDLMLSDTSIPNQNFFTGFISTLLGEQVRVSSHG
jgi:hypothetical protein